MNKSNKTVLHILSSGNIGGIEMLCKSYAKYSRNNNIFLFPWSTGVITDDMEKDGNYVIRLNAKQKNIIETFFRIRRICIKNNVKKIVIHHNAPAILLYIPFLRKSIPGIKIYMYAHSAAENMFWRCDRKKYLYYKPIVKMAAKCVDKIIAISQYVKSTVVSEMEVPPKKVTVIYNGIDMNCFNVGSKEVICEKTDNIFGKLGGVRIIYVGRLIEEKGVQVILQGLALLSKEFKYIFTIIGDGPYRQNLERLSVELEIHNHIIFMGERRDIPKLLAGADIFIHMPVCEEGFGITVIEAMASGLVCICAKSGAIPEIISDGINGFIVNKGSYQNLVEKLISLKCCDKSIIKTIKNNAVKRANDFSIEKYANRMDMLMNK